MAAYSWSSMRPAVLYWPSCRDSRFVLSEYPGLSSPCVSKLLSNNCASRIPRKSVFNSTDSTAASYRPLCSGTSASLTLKRFCHGSSQPFDVVKSSWPMLMESIKGFCHDSSQPFEVVKSSWPMLMESIKGFCHDSSQPFEAVKSSWPMLMESIKGFCHDSSQPFEAVKSSWSLLMESIKVFSRNKKSKQ